MLFTIGLHLSPKAVKELGNSALKLGLWQVVITTILGSTLLMVMGFTLTKAVFLALALSFSSTIVILKLLSDRNEIHQLHGKLSVGLLLIQDVIVSVVLIFLSANQSSGLGVGASLLLLFAKLLGLGIILWLVNHFILQRILRYVAQDQELLFVSSLAWGLGVAVLFHAFNLSLEIGALLAGVILANSFYAEEISSRLLPVRDLFLVLFFFELGLQLTPSALAELWLPVSVISLFVLAWKPLIVMGILRKLNFHPKVSFKTGVSMAQISEFSLIMIALGVSTGIVGQLEQQLVGLVALVTITLSTLAITHLNKLYRYSKAQLDWLIPNSKQRGLGGAKEKPEVLIFGYHRLGKSFITSLKRQSYVVGVVDYNPDVIEELDEAGVAFHFGDAGDSQFISQLPLEDIKLIITSIPDLESTLLLISQAKQRNPKITIIVFSWNESWREKLYARGADLVLVPHQLAADKVVYWLARYGIDPEVLRHKN